MFLMKIDFNHILSVQINNGVLTWPAESRALFANVGYFELKPFQFLLIILIIEFQRLQAAPCPF